MDFDPGDCAAQPFGEWNRIFPDPAVTLAAVDRLVHHAAIFEMNVGSCRRRAYAPGPLSGFAQISPACCSARAPRRRRISWAKVRVSIFFIMLAR